MSTRRATPQSRRAGGWKGRRPVVSRCAGPGGSARLADGAGRL